MSATKVSNEVGVVFWGVRFSSGRIYSELTEAAISSNRSIMLANVPSLQSWTELNIAKLNVLKVGFADGPADDSRHLFVIKIALPLEFACLPAVEIESEEGLTGCGADIARGNHGTFQVGPNRR